MKFSREKTLVFEAKEHLQVHLEETLGSCVLCSVFTGLLLLVTGRQDAKTGQEILFFSPFYGSFLTKIYFASKFLKIMQSFVKKNISHSLPAFFPKGFWSNLG